METIITEERLQKEKYTNEVKKDLYRSKVNANFSHYSEGKLFYTVRLSAVMIEFGGIYMFSISTVEKFEGTLNWANETKTIPMLKLSDDLGATTFSAEIKASDLNRWIAKAIEKNDFIKISQ